MATPQGKGAPRETPLSPNGGPVGDGGGGGREGDDEEEAGDDEDEWGEEAQRMLCAARFIATVGEAWKGNLTDSNAHLYVRQFHSACPGFPEH